MKRRTRSSRLALMMLGSSLVLVACGPRAASTVATAPAAEAAMRPAGPVLPAGVSPEMVAEGKRLFSSGSCARCHGASATGGQNGPSLTDGPWLHQRGSLDELVRVITDGVSAAMKKDASRRFPMNPRGGPMNLTDPQVRAVAAYVWTISRNKK